ncbi:FAD-binding protein, partial [Mesorhizobium sp. M4A.F.Ca.ET.029.04.2.1]
MDAETLQAQAGRPETFDGAIVIGAGAAGLSVALALIEAGVATQVLERESRLAEPWH